MSTRTALTSRRAMSSIPGWVLLAALLCIAIDVALSEWETIGPPPGKTETFFVELAALLALGIVLLSIGLAMPDRARPFVPPVFLVLQWHTGFQIQLQGASFLIISALDVLILATLAIALLGRWYGDIALDVKPLAQIFGIFLIFCLWGVAVAYTRGIGAAYALENLKSFTLYPLIALIVMLSIRTRRELYWSVGLMVVLITERAGEGLRQPLNTQLDSYLSNGAIAHRITGNYSGANQYAAYLATGFLIAVAWFVFARSSRLRIIAGGIIALVGIAILSTLSRGAWISVVAAVIVILAMAKMRRSMYLVLGAALLGGAVLVFAPNAFSLASERSQTVDHSLQQRGDYLTLGLDVVQAYPLGAGWGAAFQAMPGGPVALVDDPWYHDDYLQLATEISLVGVFVFAFLWVIILKRGWNATRLAPSWQLKALAAGLLAACVAFLVQAGTEQMFWLAYIAPHFWIVAGLLLVTAQQVREEQKTLALRGDAAPQ